MNAQTILELKALSEKVAMELVFAEPSKDSGLLPINCLFGQIEELMCAHTWPEDFMRGTRHARRWLNGIFESTGTFDALTLRRFGEWIEWWQAALGACENQSLLAPLPIHWENTDSEISEQSPIRTTLSSSSGETALRLNLEEDRELLAEFISESQEHLENIERGVLALEENPSHAGTLDSIFRAFHTFKGNSGFLNLTAIQTLAHELESLLELARQHKLPVTSAIVDLILEGADTLKRFVDQISRQLAGQEPAEPLTIPTLLLLENIRAALAQNSSVNETALVAPGNNSLADGDPQSTPGDDAAAPVRGGPDNTQPTAGGPAGVAVKVDTVKLDSLVDLVGEMVIAQSLVAHSPDLNSPRSEQLTRDMARLGQISKEIQRTVMSLRMVPIRATFQKMYRIVRDVAAKVGKQVELVTEGEETELDRTIVEAMSDPLIHMIRNSIDHGIEKPEVRRQRRKPEHGTVSLRAFHQGGNIVIEIKDDGDGLDRKNILAKAIQKGLVRSEDRLTDSQVFNLIMIAGFSTAQTVTDLSGRGVGMDVVRRNIEKMRGKIEIQSTPGQGSAFKIHLPLTLAMIDGLLVGVGEHRYIIPALSVCESFRPTAAMISTIYGRGEMIDVRGRWRPLSRLYDLLGVEPVTNDPTHSIVVVVEAGGNARCILVDQLLGKQEVVIKSLGEIFHQSRYVAGASILGDGRVGLILDPQALVNRETFLLEAAA